MLAAFVPVKLQLDTPKHETLPWKGEVYNDTDQPIIYLTSTHHTSSHISSQIISLTFWQAAAYQFSHTSKLTLPKACCDFGILGPSCSQRLVGSRYGRMDRMTWLARYDVFCTSSAFGRSLSATRCSAVATSLPLPTWSHHSLRLRDVSGLMLLKGTCLCRHRGSG